MTTRAQEQAVIAARIQELAEIVEKQGEALQEQKATIAEQNQTITELLNARAEHTVHMRSGAIGPSAIKAPSIPYFSGDENSCTSTKVKSFIYNVRKAGMFSNLSEVRMVSLAECHFTDAAASWLMRLEEEGKNPSTISGLQEAMIKEFVPPDERARAKIELMDCKMKSSMDMHIAKFKKLVEMTGTPIKEAYIFFFMSLPAKYKQEFHKRYPSGSPPANVDISEVYEHARTLAVAMQWSAEERVISQNNGKGRSKSTGDAAAMSKHSALTDRKYSMSASKRERKQKDDTLESWGPRQPGEACLYIKADRCMDCGKKGCKDKNHPCRQDKDKDGIASSSKNL